MTDVVAFAGVFLLTWLLVAVTRHLAWRAHFLSLPNERSSHAAPIPLGGGLPIVAVNLALWISLTLHGHYLSLPHGLVLAGAALIVATISLIDDLGHVPYPLRLGAQAASALLFILGFTSWQTVTVPLIGTHSLGLIGAFLTLIFIVGLTNSYNFMDGIDGMAGGLTLSAGLGWAALGVVGHVPLVSVLGLALAASGSGFLAHNWHPARIFMGDAGSTFLGFSFAVLPVIAAQQNPKLALAGVLLVWPAIFDPLFTVIRRLRKRQGIFSGHRSFLFHRLVDAGWSHSAAALLYIPLPLVGATLAFTWDRGTHLVHESVVVLALVACLSLWQLVRHQEKRLATRQVDLIRAELHDALTFQATANKPVSEEAV